MGACQCQRPAWWIPSVPCSCCHSYWILDPPHHRVAPVDLWHPHVCCYGSWNSTLACLPCTLKLLLRQLANKPWCCHCRVAQPIASTDGDVEVHCGNSVEACGIKSSIPLPWCWSSMCSFFVLLPLVMGYCWARQVLDVWQPEHDTVDINYFRWQMAQNKPEWCCLWRCSVSV